MASKTAFCGIDTAPSLYTNRAKEESEASVTQRRHWNAETFASLAPVGLTSPAFLSSDKDATDVLILHRASHAGLRIFAARVNLTKGSGGICSFAPADVPACESMAYQTKGFDGLDSCLDWILSTQDLAPFHKAAKAVREHRTAEAKRREEEAKKRLRAGLRKRVDREAQPLIKIGMAIDVDKVTDALLASNTADAIGEDSGKLPQGKITLALVAHAQESAK